MINLLPPGTKQIIAQEKRFQRILILIFLLLISNFCFSAALFLIKTDVQSKLLLEQQTLESKTQEFGASEIEDLENEIHAFNNALLKIDSFYKSKTYLSDTLDKIFESLPANAYLVSLSYDKNTKEISASGFCRDRDTLLELKTNLEDQGVFENIYFPASNWVKSVDIDFFISLKIQS